MTCPCGCGQTPRRGTWMQGHWMRGTRKTRKHQQALRLAQQKYWPAVTAERPATEAELIQQAARQIVQWERWQAAREAAKRAARGLKRRSSDGYAAPKPQANGHRPPRVGEQASAGWVEYERARHRWYTARRDAHHAPRDAERRNLQFPEPTAEALLNTWTTDEREWCWLACRAMDAAKELRVPVLTG